MTKPDKVKKTLVRHPEQPKTIDVTRKSSEPILARAEPAAVSTNHQFNVPEMHSTLELSKKIDKILKPSIRQTKSLSDMDKIKLAADDKVTKHVNFALDQLVYRDLIPLGDENEDETEPFTATRDPGEEIDPEPNFADELVSYKRKQIHYYCEPEIVLNGFDQVEYDDIPFDGLNRLYSILLNCEYPNRARKILKQRILNMTQ